MIYARSITLPRGRKSIAIGSPVPGFPWEFNEASFWLHSIHQIKAAIDVGWMTCFASQIERHINHSMGLTFVIPGMYRYFDLPDLAL